MLLGLRSVGSALLQVGRHVTLMVASNLAALLMSIPILAAVGAVSFAVRSFGLIPAGVVLFLGILPNPLSAGLQLAARDLVDRYVLTPHEYFSAIREHGTLALKAWCLASVVSVVIILNVLFYLGRAGSGSHSVLFTILGLIWLYAFFVWIAVHLYVFPLLVRQEDRRVLVLYRNAALMAVSRTLFTTTVTVLWILVLALCAGTGLVTVIGLALGAAIQQNAFARQLPTFQTGE